MTNAPDRPPTLRAILTAVIEARRVSLDEMQSSARSDRIVNARFAVMWIAHRKAGHSLQRIGDWLGKRDHSTVLHGVRKVDGYRETNVDLANELDAIWRRAMELHRYPRRAKFIILAPSASKTAVKATQAAVGGQTQDGGGIRTQTQGRASEAALNEAPRHWSKCEPFTPEWWQSNDLAFRQGLARAYAEAAE